MKNALNLVDVTLQYPDGDGTLKALDAVNVKLAPGEFLSLVGPSGSGKSSLLAVAATLVRPTAGLVVIDGIDAGGLSEADRTSLRRDRIGIIFQQPNLLPSLTALEQLVIGDHLRGKPARAAASSRRSASGSRWPGSRCRQASPPALRRAAATGQYCPCADGGSRGAAGGRTHGSP